MASVVSGLRPALGFLVVGLLCHQALGQAVVNVTTAAELQTALRAGEKHIRLLDHIYGADVVATPGYEWPDSFDFTLFYVNDGTASITGACTDKPNQNLLADWKPGMCHIHVPEGSGFYLEAPADVVWLDNLYIHLTGEVPVNQTRGGVNLYLETPGASVYMTHVHVEVTAEESDDTGSIYPLAAHGTKGGHFEMLLEDCQIVVDAVKAGADGTANAMTSFEGLLSMPKNATVNIVNTDYLALGSDLRWMVLFTCDMRVEDSTFKITPMPDFFYNFMFVGAEKTDTRYLYKKDAEVTAMSAGELDPQFGPLVSVLPLAQSTAEKRAALGLSPFLTGKDPELLALQAEVLGIAEVPVPAPMPSNSSGPDPASTPTPSDSEPPSNPPPVGVIVGSAAALIVLILAAVLAALCCLRRRSNRNAATTAVAKDAHQIPFVAGLGKATITAGGASAEKGWVPPNDTFNTDNNASVAPNSPMRSDWCTMEPYGATTEVPTPMRSDWCTMEPFEMTTVSPMKYAGPMTAGPAGGFVGADQVQMLGQALDSFHRQGLKLGGRWAVLSGAQRRVGGQGLVQFVRDEVHEEYCAVKFFFDGATYEREAQLYAQPSMRDMMAAVIHMEPAQAGMPAWIVLERGSSLSEWAEARKPDLLTSAQVMSQILERLERLHELKLVHRDIKPGNVLWREAARTWTLIDFGCVVDTRECKEADLSFSLPYAAPEVIHALERRDRTMPVHTSLDIWSIGVVVYELLMKARLFPAGSTAEEIKDQLAGRVPLPWERAAPDDAVPQASMLGILQEPVMSCLSRDPGARPTAQQLLKSLNDSFTCMTGGQ